MVYSNERFHVNLAASLLESLGAHPAGLGFAGATTLNASWTALGPASPRLQSPRSRAPSMPPSRPSPGTTRRFLDRDGGIEDRKSTRLNSSHANISYAVFCLKKKKTGQ